MTGLIFLLTVNLIAVGWVVSKDCVSRKGIEFNHMLLFSIGYLFYWLLPIGIGLAHLLDTGPGMSLWYSIFDTISQQSLAIYLSLALLCYMSFWLGSHVGQKISLRNDGSRKSAYRNLFFYPRLLDVVLIASVLLAAIYAVLLRDQLFRGYAVNALDLGDVKRGSFIATSLILLSIAFLYAIKRSENDTAAPTVQRLFLNRFFAAYFGVALLVLSLGGRLYFVSSLIMLMIYWTNYYRRISGRTFLGISLVLALIAGVIGSLRQLNSLDFTTVMTGLLSETLFTSFTLLSYLQLGVFDLIHIPIFLFSAFLNLIPTALLPGKAALLLNPRDYGINVFAPLGAQHLFFSFMINFGILGTLGFLFSMGWFFSYLRYADRNMLHRVFYVMLTGWLGFTFFRDDFSISLVKSMFQFSILVPGLIVITLQFVSVFLRKLHIVVDPAALAAE